MQFMLLIYSNEATEAQASKAEQEAVMGEYNAYTDLLRKGGVMVAGEALHPTHTATTVRLRDGKTMTADGPFAETKEQLGGFYIVNCKDIQEAAEWGAKCPGARHGSIEVRPLVDFSAGQ